MKPRCKQKNITVKSQRGMTLIVGLIMVLLMSIVAVSAIRGSNMQELMAGNMRDRNLAFQAAEAALRTGELIVQNKGGTLVFNDTNGLFNNQNKSDAVVGPVAGWDDDDWKAYALTLKKADIELNLTRMPDYVIELLEVEGAGAAASGESVEYGMNVEEAGNRTIYRISARGFGGSENSKVVLQSTYRAQH